MVWLSIHSPASPKNPMDNLQSDSSMTVRELAGLFASAYPLATKTLSLYIADILAVCRWYEGEYQELLTTRELTPDLVLRYRLWCAGRVRASTFNRRRTALKKLCAWAVEHKLLATNPVCEVRCVKGQRRRPK